MARTSYHVVVSVLLGSIALAPHAFAADFPTAVTNILASQTTGRIAQMGPAQKNMMIACVVNSLAGVPAGKKRFVAEGATLKEQEQRFGKVVMENRAEWKQKIANACSSIAVQGGGIGHN
jgi:hypothetical protein